MEVCSENDVSAEQCDSAQIIGNVIIKSAKNLCSDSTEGQNSVNQQTQDNTNSNTQSVLDSLPNDENEKGVDVCKKNSNEFDVSKKEKVQNNASLTKNETCEKENFSNGSSKNVEIGSALSQLLDYGLSESEDSDSDSSQTASDSETDTDNVKNKCVAEPIAEDNSPILSNVNFRENSSSDSSSSSSEYESDSSNSFSEIGACGVTPATEKKRNTEKPIVLKTRGELSMDDLPPIEELTISVPEEQCIEIGIISSVIDNLVIVQSLPNMAAYDIDTVLFVRGGSQALGRVFDVLGPVTEPLYAVRFNTHQHALRAAATPGAPVYCAPHTQHTSYVFVTELMKMKGSDASWEHNNEPPQAFLEYSDDEEERKARRSHREKRSLASEERNTNSLERNKKFEKQMNDKNILMNERFRNQQSTSRKHHPEPNRVNLPPNVVQALPPWAVHGAPMPRPDFWSAPPYPIAYQYGPLPVFPSLGVQGPRPFRVPPLMGPMRPQTVFHAPPQPFNPNIPPPIMRPQPVTYFPNPRHPRWVPPNNGVLQPPRGNFGNGSYSQ